MTNHLRDLKKGVERLEDRLEQVAPLYAVEQYYLDKMNKANELLRVKHGLSLTYKFCIRYLKEFISYYGRSDLNG